MTKLTFYPPLAPPGTPPAEAMADAKTQVHKRLAAIKAWVAEVDNETADWFDVNDVHHLLNYLGHALNVANHRKLAEEMLR